MRGQVDIALCSVLSDAGLRRSEAAALTWGDVEIAADGSGRVRIARSKTDQEGKGEVVAITPSTVQGRWKNAGTVARYTKAISAGAALQWL